MKNRKMKNYLKIGILLFGISLFLQNCEKEEFGTFDPESNKDVRNLTFKEAIDFFNKNKPISNLFAKGSEPLTVNPDWETIAHQQLVYSEASLVKADTDINREGTYYSQLIFINISGQIKNIICTTYKDKTDTDGNMVDGRMYFNEVDGTFIDAYKIEDTLFTKRLVPNIDAKVNQAGLFLFLFQEPDQQGCWNTDNLPDTGILDEVVITSYRRHMLSAGGYLTGGGSGDNYHNYVNNATGMNTGSAHGSGLTNGQITDAAGAIISSPPIDEDQCPDGLKNDFGECVDRCRDGKTYNETTKKCECTDPNQIEDKDGNCISKPCEGNPVKGGLEIAPQKGNSGTLGAMFGNSTTGGCKRYGARDCNTPRNKKHDGIDIKSEYGDPIFAMYDGFIYSSKEDKDGAGYYTRIQSTTNGITIITSYFHLQKENRLLATNPLNYVKAGDIIGYQGDSGNLKNAIADGGVDSHVHIETRKHDGSSSWGYSHFDLVDPRDYFETTIDSTGVSQANTNCN